MKKSKIQTTRELAELAGVSHMTVSRVFKNPGKVKAETRDRILALAEEQGFRPNPVLSMAMAIRNQQKSGTQTPTATLAWVHSNVHEDSWRTQPHMRNYLVGIRKRAENLGFGLDEFWIGEGGLSRKRFCDIVHARGIPGCIVAPPPGNMRHLRLRWKECVWVTFHHDSWRPLLHRVAKDDNFLMGKALRELRRAGYRKVGMALAAKLDEKGGFALQGRFRVNQLRYPEMGKIPPLLYAGPDLKDDQDLFLKWINRYKPEVVICHDGQTRTVLEEAGIRVPEDVGLVHLNLGLDTPNWTGMYLDDARIGEACVDLLVSQIQQNQRGIPAFPYEMLLRSNWRKGETTR
jgi:LacI family transcriptional regulator